MDDSISRRDAIEAVSSGCQEFRGIFAECEKNLNQLPSARTKIIRCKECKNAEERGCALFCGFWTRYTAHKGYCFKAERKEGADG